MTNQKKVLIAITKANWGGAQRYVFDMAQAADMAGFEVSVAYGAPGFMAEKLKEASLRGIPLERLGRDVSLLKDFSSFAELVSLLRKEKPAVLHLNSSKMGVLGGIAGRITFTKKILFTAHGWAFNEGRPLWQKAVIALLHYVTVVLAHETLCNSEATRRDCAWMPWVQRKIRVIRLGVSPITFLDRASARESLAPDKKNAFWIGMVGELHETKGIFEAVEGFEGVSKAYPDIRLILAGEGHAREALEKDIHARHLNEKVYLLGQIADAPKYLHAFDIFLFPSRTEALGLALLEAGMAGLPCIGTNVGGIPEIIENNTTGLLVERGNALQIKDALMRLMKDATERRRFGEALRAKVEKEFSKEKMIEETLAAYSN